jgi:hypothetical protein
VITALMVVMVGAALYLWRRTGRASAAVAVVAFCTVLALGLHLIP